MNQRRRRTAIALLAKSPKPGNVKTRFCPPCTPEEAAEFARAFLQDTAEMLKTPAIAHEADAWCSYLGDKGELERLLDTELMLPQRGDDLGERIANACHDLFGKGYERVVVLCADCPTVEAAYLEAAIFALSYNDVVFGPAHDGGCVLVALSRPAPDIFSVPMSTRRVLTDMQACADEALMVSMLLPVRHDLDTIDDLVEATRANELTHAQRTLDMLNSSRFSAYVSED